MVSKRSFLKQAAATTAVAAVMPVRSFASSEGPALRAMIDVVVFNERYADARAFASAFSEQFCTVLPLEGDAGLLWYRKLRACAGGRTTRIAGMGTHIDLLVLETLARDAGLRVRYRGEHECRESPTLTHRMCAGAASAQLAQVMASAGCGWPTELARALSHGADAAWCTGNPLQVCTNAQRAEDHPGSLVSWVLA